MLDVPNSHIAFFNSALYGHTDQHVRLHPHLGFFCCNPIWKQLPRLGAHLTTQQAEDLVALFRFLAYLVGALTSYFSSAARAKKTMEDIKDGSIAPSESSKKTTRDFINAFADKTPDKISRGFIQAGIRSMNPAPVCDALGVEAVGWKSYIASVGLRWSVKLSTVVGLPLPPTNIMIQISEAGKDQRLQADHSMEADGTVKLLWELPTVRGEWDPNT
jgi:hypothetical protein